MLAGHASPVIRERGRRFLASVPAMLEAWLKRSENANTLRSYRRDLEAFVQFLELAWPSDADRLLHTTVDQVQEWRRTMLEDENLAPKTVNRRISSVSGFFVFVRESAAQAKLPILIQNPASSDFVKRPAADPVTETAALPGTQARRLMSLPSGETVLDCRDRAILKFYLFTGARIGTGCRLKVSDFHFDEHDSTIAIHEKGHGKSKRRIGIH